MVNIKKLKGIVKVSYQNNYLGIGHNFAIKVVASTSQTLEIKNGTNASVSGKHLYECFNTHVEGVSCTKGKKTIKYEKNFTIKGFCCNKIFVFIADNFYNYVYFHSFTCAATEIMT